MRVERGGEREEGEGDEIESEREMYGEGRS